MARIEYIKNIKSVRYLTSWIFLNSQRYYKSIAKRPLKNILDNWTQERERNGELFNTPLEIEKNGLKGDCDDQTTLIIYMANKLKKCWKIGYKINKQKTGIIHIFAIVEGIVFDSWQNKGIPFKHVKKSDELIIDNVIVTIDDQFIRL